MNRNLQLGRDRRPGKAIKSYCYRVDGAQQRKEEQT